MFVNAGLVVVRMFGLLGLGEELVGVDCLVCPSRLLPLEARELVRVLLQCLLFHRSICLPERVLALQGLGPLQLPLQALLVHLLLRSQRLHPRILRQAGAMYERRPARIGIELPVCWLVVRSVEDAHEHVVLREGVGRFHQARRWALEVLHGLGIVPGWLLGLQADCLLRALMRLASSDQRHLCLDPPLLVLLPLRNLLVQIVHELHPLPAVLKAVTRQLMLEELFPQVRLTQNLRQGWSGHAPRREVEVAHGGWPFWP
mmetsp:Transcript_40182/g.95963  ORF Transcript_40182/g.95963 Transcript_40182/m.95963 type:complete len:259 (-) Transcript_40182:91-867(-)